MMKCIRTIKTPVEVFVSTEIGPIDDADSESERISSISRSFDLVNVYQSQIFD